MHTKYANTKPCSYTDTNLSWATVLQFKQKKSLFYYSSKLFKPSATMNYTLKSGMINKIDFVKYIIIISLFIANKIYTFK